MLCSSSFESYSKPATGAMGDRMTAMKSAFQVESIKVYLYSPISQMLHLSQGTLQ